MLEGKKTSIYIGLPRCGSSYLQQEIFPQIGNYYNLSNRRETKYFKTRCAFDAGVAEGIVQRNVESFDQKCDYAIISGGSFSGIGDRGLKKYTPSYREEFAKNLSLLFPEARIVLVVREFFDRITSLYCHKTATYQGYQTLKEFVETHFSDCPDDMCFGGEYYMGFDYDRLIEIYGKFFGLDNLLVLPYEQMKNNKTEFLSSLAAFIDSELILEASDRVVKPSIRLVREVELRRRMNIVRRRTVALRLLRHTNRTWTDRLEKSIWGGYARRLQGDLKATHSNEVLSLNSGYFPDRVLRRLAASNRALQEMGYFDLGTYGYFGFGHTDERAA